VADRLIRSGDADDVAGADLAQRWLTVAGDPAYESAFMRMMRDPQAGFAEFDDRERAAWRAGRILQRALGEGAGGLGGQYLVPVFIDPTIMLSNAGSNNPLRQASRVEQIATSAWNGVASAGASAEWIAEAAEVADGSPTLTQPSVPMYKGDSFVPFSFELEGDAAGLMSQLASVLADAAELLQRTAYTVGTGTAQPAGVITGATTLTQSPTGAFAAAHVTQVQNALPPRFSANARWMGNIAVLNTIALFQTANGSLVYPEVRNTPSTLLRKPLDELSDMSADMSTTGSKYLLYGDFSNFLIVDRIGSTIELVQNLFGTNRRPTGQRGALLWFRTGSAVLVPNAFRVLVKA
jgi:HK97 family phage major capsid protein